MQTCIIQVVSLVFTAISLLVWALVWWYHRERRYVTVPFLTFLAHVFIFYATKIIVCGCFPCQPDQLLFYNWSAVVRLHAIVLIVGMGLIELHANVRK